MKSFIIKSNTEDLNCPCCRTHIPISFEDGYGAAVDWDFTINARSDESDCGSSKEDSDEDSDDEDSNDEDSDDEDSDDE
jgi:hypothetical protein